MNTEEKDKMAKLFSLIGEFEDSAEVDEYLESRGYNIEDLEKRGDAFLSKMVKKAMVKEGKRKKELFNRAQELFKSLDIDNPLEVLKERIREQQASSPAFSFSKLDNISEEDALDMLEDEELMRLIQELEEKENG